MTTPEQGLKAELKKLRELARGVWMFTHRDRDAETREIIFSRNSPLMMELDAYFEAHPWTEDDNTIQALKARPTPQPAPQGGSVFEKMNESRLENVKIATGNLRQIAYDHIRACYAEIDRLVKAIRYDYFCEEGHKPIAYSFEGDADCPVCKLAKATTPASESVTALDTEQRKILDKVMGRIKISHAHDCGTQNLLMPCDCGTSDALKALTIFRTATQSTQGRG